MNNITGLQTELVLMIYFYHVKVGYGSNKNIIFQITAKCFTQTLIYL